MYQSSIRILSLFLLWDYILNIEFFFLSVLRYTYLFFCLLKFVYEKGFSTLYIRILNRNTKKIPIEKGRKAYYCLVLKGTLFFEIAGTLLKQEDSCVGFTLYTICFRNLWLVSGFSFGSLAKSYFMRVLLLTVHC